MVDAVDWACVEPGEQLLAITESCIEFDAFAVALPVTRNTGSRKFFVSGTVLNFFISLDGFGAGERVALSCSRASKEQVG
ncbi:hypothetical protein [Paenarthrobacter sp. PH39-S1]|uniref:hypothetical protein n=1 Tax=Paenarthrobacter sp. PH39-S1 TaxID=3046204 RepID=UPI0024B94308|nr:hypothetical protein [Paenarthrobacter sp. PH39-S1]MDJ0356605.1 hypothetical protein [Paenarthrobacter sp. PH39-S1]